MPDINIDIITKKFKDFEDVLGRPSTRALIFILLVLTTINGIFGSIEDTGELLWWFNVTGLGSILLVITYGLATRPDSLGMEPYRGFMVGIISGFIGLVLGGWSYYALNPAECVHANSAIKFMRLLLPCIMLGGFIGAFVGAVRSLGPISSDRQDAEKPSRHSSPENIGYTKTPTFPDLFLRFLIVIAVTLLFLSLMNRLADFGGIAGQRDQGNIRVWQVSMILAFYSIAFTQIAVLKYGWQNDRMVGTPRNNLNEAIRSAAAALVCSIVLFGLVSLMFGTSDFEARQFDEALSSRCPNDPTNPNSHPEVWLNVLALLFATIFTFLGGTHSKSPVLILFSRFSVKR